MEKVQMNTEKTKADDPMSRNGNTRRGGGRAAKAAAAALALLLCGCSQALPAQEQEKTKLRVIYSDGDIRWTGTMEWLADQFMEKNPDVEVTIEAPSNIAAENFTDRLKALIAQDEFYDVVELREASQFAEAGYLAPLPERLTNLILPDYRETDTCYAIPRYTTTLGIIYNRNLFGRLGLSEPESYEEFLQICETVREAGINPIAVGGADIWHMNFWGNYLFQNEILDEQGICDWSKEHMAEIFSDFRELNRRGYIADRFFNVSDSQTVQELSSGESAMLYSGPWMLGQVKGLNPQMELGFFFLPGKDGRTYAEADTSVTWGISKACLEDEARYEAAGRFLEFFYSEGIYEHVLSEMNADAVTVRQVESGETEEQKIVHSAYHDGILICDRMVGDEETPDGFRTFYHKSLQEVLWSSRPVMSIAEEIQNRWEAGDD